MCLSKHDQTFWIFHFLCVFGFLHTQNKSKKKEKRKIKSKNNAYREMQDAQMHEDITSKELDQGPKE